MCGCVCKCVCVGGVGGEGGQGVTSRSNRGGGGGDEVGVGRGGGRMRRWGYLPIMQIQGILVPLLVRSTTEHTRRKIRSSSIIVVTSFTPSTPSSTPSTSPRWLGLGLRFEL